MDAQDRDEKGTPAAAPGAARGRSGAALWLVVLAAIALNVVFARPMPDASARLATLRTEGRYFASREVPLTPGEAAVLRDAGVVRRSVAIGGSAVLLTVIDPTRNRHALHDPLFCFRSAGQTIASTGRIELPRGWGAGTSVDAGEGPKGILYWFSDGEAQHGSTRRAWAQSILRRLTRGLSGGEPVVVILSEIGGAPPDWTAILERWPELAAL